ncbi:MAG: tripartite tricarboxylate transporter substrate binding protein [Pseudomonadota bacterium]|nr:tripartite tricarboxylate transporter substrate binding protein [Burkholderiaceae bacterium]MDQ3447166.1 tripartite tricarboxylate transporter substrate binding protein [Pseudomonadota bacterium]
MVRMIFVALVSLISLLSSAPAYAQEWPSKTVRFIVGYPAGGGHDFVARTVAQRMSEQLKQPFVVENRSGASGAIGTDHVAKSDPDGYTLLIASPAEVLVGPIAGQKVPYDPAKDLVPVALIGETPLAVALHPSVPANTMQELLALARRSPGKLSYGTPGTGSSHQFAGESIKAIGDVFIVHIPYRGAAPAVTDLLGGQVEIGIAGMPPVIGHHKSGKLKIVAVTSAKRSAATPDIPSVAELPGFAGFHFTNWQGVYAAAKTPPAVVQRIAAEIANAVRDPATRQRLLAAGVDPLGLGPSEFSAFLAREQATYTKVAKDRNIKLGE